MGSVEPWWSQNHMRRLKFSRSVFLWGGVFFVVAAWLISDQATRIIWLTLAGALLLFARSSDRSYRQGIRDSVLRQLEGEHDIPDPNRWA